MIVFDSNAHIYYALLKGTLTKRIYLMQQHKILNSRGVSHHFLLPVLAVLVVAGIGGYIMQRSSSAATTTEACNKITFGRYRNNPVYTKYKKYKPCVQAIQRKVGANADGIYGNYTQSRVKIWQKNHNMSNADGVVGSATWAKMGLKTTYTNTPTTTTTKAKETVPATYQNLYYCEYMYGKWPVNHLICRTERVQTNSSRYKTLVNTHADAWAKCFKDHKADKSFCKAYSPSDSAPQSVIEAAEKELRGGN